MTMHILGSPDRIRSLYVFGTRLLAAAMLVTFALPAHSQGRERSVEHPTVYRTVHAPLAERRAQALSVDQAQLRELLGDAELRELLDADSIAQHERGQQRLLRPAHGVDGLHDLLLALGDLSEEEIRPRFQGELTTGQLFQ